MRLPPKGCVSREILEFVHRNLRSDRADLIDNIKDYGPVTIDMNIRMLIEAGKLFESHNVYYLTEESKEELKKEEKIVPKREVNVMTRPEISKAHIPTWRDRREGCDDFMNWPSVHAKLG